MNVNETIFDVCVVGSGAAGGTLSARLARRGLNVLVMEGGPRIDVSRAFNTHAMPYDFKNRKMPIMVPGVAGFEDERTRGVGGKTLLWNAVAWRLSHRDFKGHSYEGAGVDWPIDYSDLAPYYDQIETEVGVCGNPDHLEDLPDGQFLPPMPMRCSDRIVQQGATRLGIPVIHVRKATLTRPREERPACHYCGNCMAGCDVVAKYDAANVQLFPAQSTGKLTILSDSIVCEVTLRDKKRVNGVRYLNRNSLKEGRIQARSVVVSCACVQSIALLLMSRSPDYPGGLANSSGQLGRHYLPHFTGQLTGFARELIGSTPGQEEGALDHAYIPSYMHNRKRDYFRSFGIQFNYHNRRLVPWAKQLDGFGGQLKKAIRDRYPAYVNFAPYGEMLPSSGSTVDLDPVRQDRFGLPRARLNVRYGQNERKLFAAMRSESRRILEASGVEILDDQQEPRTNHELGGCRMGHDPASSVLNAYCQTHDIPNLFVVDGSVFPSASEKNPTLTIMALAARTADYVVEQFQKGTLG
jgi:glucoside 3-dehydrogenase (cytochrome c) catalytic subunit